MSEILWAPWRLEYIQKGSGEKRYQDIFVELPAENEDAKNLIVWRGEHAFVMMNRFPYANGHLMVAPYRQVATIEDLDDQELLEINQLLAKAVVWLKAIFRPDGFNLGVNLGQAAGAGIPVHIHWHVVPRWSGDHNFMPVIGDVRVIPQSLEDTYRLLQETISRDA